MSQNVPTLSCGERERTEGLAGVLSTDAPAGARLGALGGLCIVAPDETYERMNLLLNQRVTNIPFAGLIESIQLFAGIT